MIEGIQKLSLVDYPHEPAFVIFLGGCNFKCPFCHNKGIVNNEFSKVEINDVLEMISIRKNFIKAIVVTGGEPTIHGDKLIDLIKKLKKFNLKIKLDTNGSNPSLLETIINEKLVDYIAMDIKNTFEKYNNTVGTNVNIDNIKKSIQLIQNSGLEYEFRTTVNKDMHTKDDIIAISNYVNNKKRYFLQPYKYSDNQIKLIHYNEYSTQELQNIKDEVEVEIKV